MKEKPLDMNAVPLDQWAADQLGVSPASPPATARAAFFHRLQTAGFVPSLQEQAAFLFMQGAPSSSHLKQEVAALAQSHLERQGRAEVQAFVEQFFDVPIRERRRRWQDLLARSRPCATLTARLRTLEPGLDVDPSAIEDANGDVGRLAGRACQLCCLGPAEQALRRQQILEELAGEIVRWESAAQRLRQQAPAIARLAPVFIERLANWTSRVKRLAEERLQKARGERPPVAATGWNPGLRLSWVVIVGIVLLARLLIASNAKPPSPPTIKRSIGLPSDFEQQRRMQEILRNRGEDEQRPLLPDMQPLGPIVLPKDPEDPVP